MTTTVAPARKKHRPVIRYKDFAAWVEEHIGYKDFTSNQITSLLREKYPKEDPLYLLNYTSSALKWCEVKKQVKHIGKRPALWRLTKEEERVAEIADPLDHGIFIVEIAHYETLTKKVDKYREHIKALISTPAHEKNTRVLAAVLQVPYSTVYPHKIIKNRNGVWYVPPGD